ncbi:transglycosylase domain-containing protein [Persicobacter diffluens]
MLNSFLRLSVFGKIMVVLLCFFLAGCLSVVGFVWSVKWGTFGDLPVEQDLRKIENAQASLVYSEDGRILGKYFIQERSNIKYEDLSPDLVHALVATEDARFFEHDGVDYRAWGRVLVKTVILGQRSAGGGSTLTQQLAKNLFPRDGYGKLDLAASKIKEVLIARQIESIYSKEEIINLYLNTVPFGDNSYGIRTAARKFFSKEPKELSLQESAVLIGMLKANYYYNPRVFPERSKERRDVVISQMEKYGYLNAQQEDSLQQLPLEIKYRSTGENEGLATYFREQLKFEVKDILDSINQHLEAKDRYDLNRDGLKIHTTLNYRMQELAEEAMREHMSDLQKSFDAHWKGKKPWARHPEVFERAKRNSNRYKELKARNASKEEIEEAFNTPVSMEILTHEFKREKLVMTPNDSLSHFLHFLNMGMIAMEPRSGEVKVYIGGIDHRYLKINHAKDSYKRQVGSTIKPLVYATALDQGAKACNYYPAAKQYYLEDPKKGWLLAKLPSTEDLEEGEEVEMPDLEDAWAPGNADGKYEGLYSMKGALTNSVNTVSVQVEMEAGLVTVGDYLEEFGLSGIERDNEDRVPPSTVLGTPEVSIQEMVNAYAVLANGGYKVRPRYLTKIVDGLGNVIYEQAPAERGERVIKQSTDHQILAMMQNVVNNGTGGRLRYVYGLRNDLAGKTGTTQSNTDGWFMAMTPRLVVGTWVGNDEPAIRWRSTRLGQGANTALPVFGKFMQKLNKESAFRQITHSRFPSLTHYELQAMNCEDWIEEPETKSFNDVLKDIFKSDPIKKQERIQKREEKREPREPKDFRKHKRKKNRKKFFEKIFG